ncbi:MAG: diaminopimelate decarboxylase [Alphaproteobacteria bacterium]|nr:diaminopimelate decarboxylase [Alphaproteobacteria bacterium]
MAGFLYRNGTLHAEEVPLARIAEAVGTPFYCYSTSVLVGQYRAFKQALGGTDAMICYALKANSNQAVIRTFAELGAGADVVSEGELRRALAAGVPAERIVFAGVGKTRDEMAVALDAGILQFNVESEPELAALDEVARSKGRRAQFALRVNPDVAAGTHAKITTGTKENKFGIDIGRARRVYDLARNRPGLQAASVAVHIGSQLTDLAPFRSAFARVRDLVGELRADGHDIRRMDFGGGLGVAYRDGQVPAIADYLALVREAADGLACGIIVEPGRIMVAEAGVLVSRVIYVKSGEARRFIVVDSAMNDLIRPTLYEAYHAIVAVREPESTGKRPDGGDFELADVVGPICESGDYFAQQRPMPRVADGDLLAIKSAGAYGAVMSSSYNSRLLIPEVLVNGEQFAVVRPRPRFEDLLGQDRLPPWQTGTQQSNPSPDAVKFKSGGAKAGTAQSGQGSTGRKIGAA